MRRASGRSHARFHFVTDLANYFSLSKVDLVVQFLPGTSISIQSESKSLTTLHFLDFLVLLGDRPNKVWKLYGVGKSSCAPYRVAFNTFLSVTFHVVAPSCDVFGIFLCGFDICACADQLREQFLFLPSRYCY